MGIKNYGYTYKRLLWASSHRIVSRKDNVVKAIDILLILEETFKNCGYKHADLLAKEVSKVIAKISDADETLKKIEMTLPSGFWARDLILMRDLVFGATFDALSEACDTVVWRMENENPVLFARDYVDTCKFILELHSLANAVESNRIVIESFDPTDKVWFK